MRDLCLKIKHKTVHPIMISIQMFFINKNRNNSGNKTLISQQSICVCAC